MPETIVVNEVGPRDGLQNQPKILTIEQRLQLIDALLAAGLHNIEIGAFVSPAAVPAMAGSDDLARRLPQRGDVHFSALIPNRKGYDIGRASGVKTMGLVVAATQRMNEKNIRMSTEQAMTVARDVIAQARRDDIAIEVNIATAWECPYEGRVDAGVVIDMTRQLFAFGAHTVIIADTIGGAQPRAVRDLMQVLVDAHGSENLRCHFHDTRALGMANVYAALESGVRAFDAAIGSLGGCPFAPGATGNIATEDLVMLLSMMGYHTGIDMEKLLAAAQLAGALTQVPVGGRATPWLRRNFVG